MRRVAFILDGVDQLDDFDADLLAHWLPGQLPFGVKLVVSLRSGDPVDKLRPKLPDSAFFQVQHTPLATVARFGDAVNVNFFLSLGAQLDELTGAEARHLFDACLVQQAHSSHGDHLAAMAGQIDQPHRPLTVKVKSTEPLFQFRSRQPFMR